MALPALPHLRDLIRLYGLRAKQELSQNFILDLNVSDKIVQRTIKHSGPLFNKTIIEVGPGPGPLTRSILNAGCQKLILIEKDKRFLPTLEMIKEAAADKAQVDIVCADVMKVDEREILEKAGMKKKNWEEDPDILILGNLPFALATELLLKWIRQIHYREGAFHFGRADMALTFQKEVAHRIVAQPGIKTYNRLSVMVQHGCDAKHLFDIGSKNFVPQPKVDAGVVFIRPRIEPVQEIDIKALELLCRHVFQQKRKRMSNSIKTISPDAGVLLELAGIEQNVRPEDVPVDKWCLLSNIYKSSVFYNEEL